MKTTSRAGIDVYDFNEEDDEVPDQVAKFSVKCKNPSHRDRRNSKDEFLQTGSEEANIQTKEASSIPCVDADAVDKNQCGKDAISRSPLETVEEDFVTEKEYLKLDAAAAHQIHVVSIEPCVAVDTMDHDNAILHSCLGTMEEDLATRRDYSELNATDESKFLSRVKQSESDNNGCRDFLCEPERGDLNTPSPFPGNKPIDVILEADESSSELPSSPLSPIEEDEVSMGTCDVGDYSGNSEMDNINMTVVLYPDYVVYRDSYCTGAQELIFSHSCIKISGSAPSENDEIVDFEWGVDDLVNVECQWYQNAEFVLIKLHVLSKGAAQDDGALGTSGIEELKIGVVEPNWSHQQEKIARLNVKYLDILDPVQIMEVDDSLGHMHHIPNFEEGFETLVYPKGDPDAVSITKRDVDLLQPEIFINDTLIDFYIKYLENRLQPKEKQRFYFFNSFFFRKLADLDKDPSSVSGGRAAFQRVRKWTRKVDLFEKDYIFIPVNFNLHWTLIVICHPGEVHRYKVGESGKSVKVPCILHLDSLKGSHTGLKNHVQSYLWEEWKEKKKETSEEISSNFHNLRFLSLELPQQENTYDCGLFLLHYLELFLEQSPAIFNPFNINKFSTFLNANWFLPSEASLKRSLIQRSIFELLKNCYQEVCLPACTDGDEAKYNACNQLETSVKYLSGRSSSQLDQGIEMTLLPTSSLKSSECVSDAGLVLREFFQSGDTAGSLFGQYQSFQQKSPLYHPKGATPPIEEELKTGEQFTYPALGDTGYPEIFGLASRTCGVPCSSTSYRAETSDTLRICEQAANGNIDASHERSDCASDHSEDIEIIENSAVGEDLGPSQKEDMSAQNYSSLESVKCGVHAHVPGLSELQTDSMTGEVSQEHEEVDGHVNGGPSQTEESSLLTYLSKENVVCLANGLASGSDKVQSACVIEESSVVQMMVHNGNENGGSLPSSQEMSDIPMHEAAFMVGNATISCDDVQMFDDGLVGESQEPKLEEPESLASESQEPKLEEPESLAPESQEQRAAKRMKVVPPVEGEKCVV